MTPEPDLLADLLAPPSTTDARGREFAATLAGLRRLRRGTNLRRAIVPALAFVLGGGVMAWAMPEKVRETVRVEPVEVVRDKVVVVEKIVRVYEPPAVEAVPMPWEIERLAASAPDEARAKLYRLAAERWLEEGQQVGAALRCYGAYLDAAGPAGLDYADDDSSLLASLKRERRQTLGEKQ